MVEPEATIWCVRAGNAGQADSLFLKNRLIALGFSGFGDAAQLKDDRETFKARVAETNPDAKPGAIPIWAGVMYRYVHEMQIGDVVVYPSKRDRQIHLGRVTGAYRYEPKVSSEFPHHRSVEWIRKLPRTHFSQGALHEIGSAVTLFSVRNYADEFRAALEGKTAPAPVESDETVALIAEEIEQTTSDFILKTLAQELKGHPFAGFVAHLLGAMGYRTRVAPEGPDGGVDIIAHKDELGFEPPLIKVQVKSTEGAVGDPIVSALYGKVGSGEYGLLVTLGRFTPAA